MVERDSESDERIDSRDTFRDSYASYNKTDRSLRPQLSIYIAPFNDISEATYIASLVIASSAAATGNQSTHHRLFISGKYTNASQQPSTSGL